jgi:TPR repeat protein
MNETKDFALVRRPSGAVEKTAPGMKRISSDIVTDTLNLAKKAASREVRISEKQLEGWYRMGKKYFDALGVPDYAEAVKWFGKAAAQNHAKAQYYLGVCYYYSYGVGRDYAEALKWFGKAAAQNNAWAQFHLGFCYAAGECVAKDEVEAVKWYRKAAEQGDAQAQKNLGNCYKDGFGVPQDFIETYKLYKSAAEQNHENAAEALEQIATRMTAVEIAEGERRYREFSSRKKLSK